MKKYTVGFALCGSFCTFDKVIRQIRLLCKEDYEIIPIMSFHASATDTRFGKAADFITELETLTGHTVIRTLDAAEPIGPKNLLDILVVAPCTGNTLAKFAAGIADTPVTLAVKSQLRNAKPVLLAVSTNDALAGAAKNIGNLHNMKNFFFVPYRQDAPEDKPNSCVADFSLLSEAISHALAGRQLQPLLLKNSG